MFKGTLKLAATATVAALTLAGCAGGDPLQSGSAKSDNTITIGSQDYYSNEIIAEIYAQALEAEDYKVDRQYRIGQREVYVKELESGAIDLMPEYTGPLLQYWEPDLSSMPEDEVYAKLREVTPGGLRILEQSPATDQDSYVVTRDFAAQHDLKNIADLKNAGVPLTLGANSEVETRAYGPAGVKEAYGVELGFTPIEDGGGPLTVKALQDGDIQVAIIYTADPAISKNNLVSLGDPKGILLPSHVVPIASDRLDAAAEKIVNKISLAMTPEELVALNARSVDEKLSAKQIASEWLAKQKL